MKRWVLVSGFLLGGLLCAPVCSVFAEEDAVQSLGNTGYYNGGSYMLNYSYTDTEAAILGCSASDEEAGVGDVVIPSELDGLPVTLIEECAFYGCETMTSVSIPDTVQEIGYGAFYDCLSLQEVTIPDSVTILGEQAFSYCVQLKTVQLSDHLSELGQQAFYNCQELTTVCLPQSLSVLGDYVFEGCLALESLEVEAGNTALSSLDGVLFSADQTVLIKYPEAKAGEQYTVPATVKELANWAFVGAKNLKSVDLGQVTTMGDDAFYYCTSLEEVRLSEGLEALNGAAFGYCSALKTLTIPDSVRVIGDYAFVNCSSLTHVTIPSSVEEIGDYAFGFTYDSASADCTVSGVLTMECEAGSVAAAYAKDYGISYQFTGESRTLRYLIIGAVIVGAAAIAVVLIVKRRGKKTVENSDWESRKAARAAWRASMQEAEDAPEQAESDKSELTAEELALAKDAAQQVKQQSGDEFYGDY